jgi:hypothetical protein
MIKILYVDPFIYIRYFAFMVYFQLCYILLIRYFCFQLHYEFSRITA